MRPAFQSEATESDKIATSVTGTWCVHRSPLSLELAQEHGNYNNHWNNSFNTGTGSIDMNTQAHKLPYVDHIQALEEVP